jgi:PiT family inorganic phosphate transporter
MSEIEIVVYSTIITALFFDFVNGFHDSANSIATVVGTKVLKPLQAVGMAALPPPPSIMSHRLPLSSS